MKSRHWFLISLLLLVAAALCWRQGERLRQREQPRDGATNTTATPTVWERFTRLPYILTGRPVPRPSAATAAKPPELLSLSRDPRLPFRLRNSDKKEAELFRSETAVLLRNALVETTEPLDLRIPEHLRAADEPGSWLVQARGTIDQKFRDVLRGAGAEIVSYVPNNTYLVRGSANLAQQLRVSPRVQSVLPFEPYYKLDMTLLPLAVRRDPMPAGRWLNVVLFAGTQEKAKADLRALGAEVKSEQRFPFGHVVTIAPPADSLVALARMPAVQNIEAWHSPVLMNDLSRVRLDVSPDTTASAPGGNHLNLTGAGVFLGLVDSGVDLAHGQLSGRTFLNAASPAVDVTGHGTFVAGVMVALDSPDPNAVNGSLAGATYRGIAPGARVYPLSLYSTDYTNYANTWLITNAALATNIFIVNNSWGYPVTAYDINSALFDEAVRDSVPFRTNDQPVTHVFAVGNSGGANSGGTGGNADSINSPGNGKNIISVGATEQFRLVPNSTVSTNTGTNDPIAVAHSDSADQVADFSGRGNVGVGVEGPSGRMKPDLVAPGDYVVSLRASTFTNVQESDFALGSAWRYERGTSVAAGKVSGLLALMQEFFSVNFGRTNGLKPSLNKALLINRARSLNGVYDFAVNGSVTHQGWGFPSLSNTVPAAALVSFLTNAGPVVNRIVLLEESALVTNHLASGQFHAFDVQVPAVTGLTNNLKITLAWTDPAGNPVSSTKLVNDLDLYVTNLVANGRQFEGNNFAPGSTVTQPTVPGTPSARDSVNNVENAYIPLTNAAATTFRVYVVGRKVNVNAVTANTNQVAQDYSVVFSTDAAVSLTVQPTPGVAFSGYTNRPINIVTNGIPKLDERVGANSQLWTVNGTANANTNGVTNQWNFYVFTNQSYASSTATNFVTNIVAGTTNVITNIVRLPLTNSGPYVGFATFLPPNLARSRNAEADLDMFVTRSSLPYPPSSAGGITNLDPAVLASANVSRSTNRGGYELITFSNSTPGEVFFVGVKSEDQQGGAYGFFGAASQTPFGTNTTNGGVIITLFPAPMDIPDGSPDTPGGVVLYGICATNIVMQSISNYITYVHENLGDLVGTLTHNGTVITLNNHTVTPTGPFPGAGPTNYTLIYDDFRNPPDGPGDVTDLVGQDGIGLWIFEVYDNSPLLTGRVENASIYMMPYTNQYSPTNGIYIRIVTLQAGQSFVDFLDVPVTATNLDVDVIGGIASIPGPASPGTGVDLMAGVPGLIPTSSNYSIGTFDLDGNDQTNFPHLRISAVSVSNLVSGAPAPVGTPSLIPGRWNFRIVNNTSGTLTLTNRYTLGLNFSVADNQLTYTNALVSLLDNYTTNLFLNIAADRVIAGVDVGMAILHPRVSDLVIHLVAPSGRKVLLFEDRGGTNGVTTPNLRANFTENTNYVTHIDTNGLTAGGFQNLGMLRPIKFIPAPYSAVVSPPTLVTNITNLLFGFPGAVGAPGAFQESPAGLAHHGNSLFMPGKVNRNGTNDGFLVSYHTPITNKAPTVVNYTANFSVNTIYDTVTNWAVSNIWPGSISGYRGGDTLIGSPVPEQTYFNGVAANSDGVFAVGQTRNYFPPTTLTWSGTNTRQVFDIDLGCSAGSVRLDHVTDALRDRILMEYEGRTLLDYTPGGAGPLREVNTVNFSGASHFLRVVMNPTVSAAVGSSWTNTLTVYRNSGVTFAVNNLVNGPVNVRPPTLAPVPAFLDGPEAVALDATNDVYVADSLNNRIVKLTQVVPLPSVLSHNGTYVPLTLGAAGHPAPRDQLSGPKGVAVRANGDIFVADTANNLIKRFDGAGTWIESWGDATAGTAGNEDSGVGGFTRGRFNGPQGLSIGTNDVVYVADTGSDLIRAIDLASGLVSTVALPAAFVTTDGNLNKPRGVVVVHGTAGGNDVTQLARLGSSVISDVNLYVTDTDNNRVVWLQRATPVTWNAFHLAGGAFPAFASGRVDNQNALARFDKPSGITVDGHGNLYVTDAATHLVRRVTPLGDVQTIAGDYAGGTFGSTDNDVGGTARFNTPRGLVADRFGTLFVADSINDRVRIVTPYQSRTPTNAFVAYFPFNGPTNPVMGASPVFFSRGITNSVFGLELGGADSRDSFHGVATSAETGPNGTITNFLYAVGKAQFSRDDSTVPPLAGYDRMFLTKFATNGQPIWTRGHMPVAVMHPVLNGANDITSLVLDYGGAGYGSVPAVTILDPTNPNPAKRSISVTVTVTGGVVDPPPPTAVAGPFIAPRVFVEAPVSPNMPGNAVAVAYGTNVIAAGFTNIATGGLTNNLPFLLCLETTNGSLRFATNSPNSGHYNSVAVYGDKLLAVGAAYAGGNTLQCSNLIEQWSLIGGTQTLSAVTGYGVGRTGSLSQVVAIESLDRAYAVGSVTNSDNSVDAVLVEIDLQNLAVISTTVCNITNFTGVALANYGKAITTDGVDLYVAVEGPGDGNASDRQAAIFRYRAKNFYQPEESLNAFVGERTWGTSTFYTNVLGSPTNYTVTNTAWRLQIADTRAGGTNASFTTNGMVISWNLNFSYAASNTTALALAPAVNNPVVLLSTTPKYFQVKVPSAAGVATNLITASAPVRVTFNPAGLPTPGAPGNVQMFSSVSTGSFIVSTNTNAVARLRPGSEYYIAIQAMSPGPPVDVTVRVDFDRTELSPPITPLSSGVPVNGLALRTPSLGTYSFEVPANASAAMFEIVAADGDVNLYLRRSNSPSSLPTAQQFDYVSANLVSGVEQIFLVTNAASAAALTPGTWYLGVQNADNSPVAYSIRATAATATPYNIVTAGNGQPQNGVTSPGNAPNMLFKMNVPIAQKALLFEVRNLTGPGDLIVRRNTFPLATTFDGANARPEALPEIVTLRTNGTLPTVAGDWYFGVLNPGAAHIAYTVMGRQPTNGVLLSSSPIQILGTPGGGLLTGGTSFGFDLDVVPGEKYQVQYKTNLTATSWLVLTNIVAPADGVINFIHSGALTNKNLYYRIQVVP